MPSVFICLCLSLFKNGVYRTKRPAQEYYVLKWPIECLIVELQNSTFVTVLYVYSHALINVTDNVVLEVSLIGVFIMTEDLS